MLGRSTRIAAVTLSLVLFGAASVTTSTQAAPADASDAVAASATSAWLASELQGGTFANPLNPAVPDHGLMIDALIAMYASGDGSLAAPIVEQLDTGKQARKYFTYYGFGEGQDWLQNEGLDDRVGGATAKVLVAAQVSGRNPRDFGGYDMVKETQNVIVHPEDVAPGGRFAEGSTVNPLYTVGTNEVGRVIDFGPTTGINNANTIGQSLAVIGLAGAGVNDSAAIDKLAWQQCAEGYFRIFYSYAGDTNSLETCDAGKRSPVPGAPGEFQNNSAPDRDATAMGLSAMLSAQEAGAQGLQGRIDRAATWLTSEQTTGGGWGGGVSTEAPNTNSTGLVVQALYAADGDSDAVRKGAAYLRSAQVVDADSSSKLAKLVGAIGYTPADYTTAKAEGVTGTDTWIRASSQAALGISRATFWELIKGKVPQNGSVTPPTTPTAPTPPPTVPPPTPTFPATPITPTTPTRPVRSGTPATHDVPRHGIPMPVPRPSTDGPAARPLPRSLAPDVRLSPTVAQVAPAGSTVGGPALEAGSPTAAGRLGRYLAGQLVNGNHVEVTDGKTTYVDYDATADTVFALRSLGEQPQAASRASAFLLSDASIAAYVDAAPYDAGATYAVPAAKTILIAEMRRRDGNADPRLETTVTSLSARLGGLQQADGRFVDAGAHPDDPADLNRHIWATLALTATGATPQVDRAKALLRSRQCVDGSFGSNLANQSCATGEMPATATAMLGLVTVRATPGAKNPITMLSGEDAASARRALDPLVKAVPTGRLDRPDGSVDLSATALLVAGRQAAGLDNSSVARSVAGAVRADGGVAIAGKSATDSTASRSAANAVAGRSWIGTASSPVVFASLGPAAPAAPPTVASLPDSSAGPESWWRGPYGLILAAGLALALGVCGSRIHARRQESLGNPEIH